jgi:hypothetical protein
MPGQALGQVHINVSLQPLWGPTGYNYVQYYYIPDIDAYYNVAQQEYVFAQDGRWVSSPFLPPNLRGFDLYRAHKVVINEPTPWLRHDVYRNSYVRYRGHFDQQPIRDSRDYRYYENPSHPMHNQWHGHEGETHTERNYHREWHGEQHHDEHHRDEHYHR